VAATRARSLTDATFSAVLLPAVAIATALVVANGVATTPTSPDSDGATRFERSLDRLPASALDAEGATLTYVDMDLAWDRAGVGADGRRLDQLGVLVDPESWTQPPQLFSQRAAQVDAAEAEVGFSMFDIEREIAVLAPPRNVTIAETSVTSDDIAAAVESDPLWSTDLTTVESADGAYFQWTDDPAAPHVDRITPMRPLGQGGQLAVVADDAGSTVVRTLDPADMEAVLSTVAGSASSLLDTEFFAATVDALGKGAVLQAIGVPAPQPFDPGLQVLSTEALAQALPDVALVPAYGGVLIAELYDGERTQTEVLFAYGDAATAASSAPAFEQALAEGIDTTTNRPLAEILPGASVSVDGAVVVVTLPSQDGYRRAQQMLFARALFPTG
jgi:hypothetical protein